MHQVSRTVDSITLSWSQPDQPNGVILDYELQYYEKVSMSPPAPTPQEFLSQCQPRGPAPTSLRIRLPGSLLPLQPLL